MTTASIPIAHLRSAPFQPPIRTESGGEDDDLVSSIENRGVIQFPKGRPMLDGSLWTGENLSSESAVRAFLRREDGAYVGLVYGHRRIEARKEVAKRRGTDPSAVEVELLIESLTEEEAYREWHQENELRGDLNPFEEAASIEEYHDRGHSLDEIADIHGRSRPWVRSRIRIFDLPDWVEDLLRKEEIAFSAGQHLWRLWNLKEEQHEHLQSSSESLESIRRTRVDYARENTVQETKTAIQTLLDPDAPEEPRPDPRASATGATGGTDREKPRREEVSGQMKSFVRDFAIELLKNSISDLSQEWIEILTLAAITDEIADRYPLPSRTALIELDRANVLKESAAMLGIADQIRKHSEASSPEELAEEILSAVPHSSFNLT